MHIFRLMNVMRHFSSMGSVELQGTRVRKKKNKIEKFMPTVGI